MIPARIGCVTILGRWPAPLGWAFLLCLAFLSGCSEDENPLGFDRGPRGGAIPRAETLLVAAPAADAEIRPTRTTGDALSILVGSDERATARGLLRFGTLPDTTGLRFAYLHLHAKRGRGSEVLSIVVRRLGGSSDSWKADEVTWETQPAAEGDPLDGPRPVRTGLLEPDRVDTIPRIAIPIALIREWKQSPDGNAGLQIAAEAEEDEGGMARIVSPRDLIYDQSGAILFSPTLSLHDASGAETIQMRPTAAAYVITDKRPPPSGADPEARVSAGPPARLATRFDLTGVPREAAIIRATLSFALASGPIPLTDPARLALYEVTEEWTEDAIPDTLRTATISTVVRNFADSVAVSLSMEIAPLVQAWIEGRENHGVMLRFADETASANGVRLSTREGTAAPALRIVYLRPLKDRWEALP